MIKNFYLLSLSLLIIFSSSCKKEIHTIAFYNLENLFDTLDNPKINDNEFLPDSEKQWNTAKYYNKLDSLAKVISQIGASGGPEILGLCEMENRMVLEDLRNRSSLKNLSYQIAHIESQDRRGIDVALFFKSDYVLDTALALEVEIEGEPDFRTRNILYVRLTGKRKEVYHFYVNHWPSRYGGREESNYKRMAASNSLKRHLIQVFEKDTNANIVIMGDFNDETTDASLQNLKGTVINTFAVLDSAEKGSYRYRDNWNMLDQILISPALMDGKNPDYVPGSAGIFERDWLKQKGENNRYKGYPLRTWGGSLYLGGFSDHFPVFIYIEK